MKLSDFTMPEIRKCISECNFTNDQLVLFEMRTINIPLEECAERMNISVSTANRLHKQIKEKIERI